MYPTSSNPRSILKHSQSASYPQQTAPVCINSSSARPGGSAVRFPSSPKMSTVYFTHCPTSYDRRPIVVLPNTCALPDRGGRDLSGASSSSSPHTGQTSHPQSWGNHVHPSVFGRMCSSGAWSDEDSDRRHSSEETEGFFTSMVPPAFGHDDVSSEESDGIASPPPESCPTVHSRTKQSYTPPSQSHLHSEDLSHPPIPDLYSSLQCHAPDGLQRSPSSDYSLSFLPHAPSSSYTPRKRSEKKRSAAVDMPFSRKSSPTGSFCGGSSWADAEESSCLGGF